MSKKKPKLKPQFNIESEPVHVPSIEDYRLPVTLGKPSKEATLANDAAFDCISGMFGNLPLSATPTFLGYQALVNLRQNGLVSAAVDLRAKEMTRKWGELTRKGEDDSEQDKLNEITEEMERFKIRDLFKKAAQLNGYLGGCLLFIDTGEDNLANPLILDRMTFREGSLRGFKIIEPFLVTPSDYNSVNPMAPDYFRPNLWFIQGIPVHTSRLIYFAENDLPTLLKPAYNFFGLSMSQKILDSVVHYTQNREAAGRLLQKYALTVLKTNMEDVLTGGFDQALRNRIKYFVQTRSNDGCAAIDKENEDLVIQTTSLAGVVDIVRQSMEYVAAMCNEPVTKMWGLSPNGFSTGEAELQNHYDNIESLQKEQFGEPMKRVLRVIQQNMYGEIDESIMFNFVPLSDKNEKEIAETNKIQAETDNVLITAGVVSPEEARKRLIDDGNSGYNSLTEEPEEMPDPIEPFDPALDPEEEKKEVTIV